MKTGKHISELRGSSSTTGHFCTLRQRWVRVVLFTSIVFLVASNLALISIVLHQRQSIRLIVHTQSLTPSATIPALGTLTSAQGTRSERSTPVAVAVQPTCPRPPAAIFRTEKIVLISALFGGWSIKPHLSFFLRGAAHSQMDVLLVGDTRPQQSLPENVKWLNMTWEELWERVRKLAPQCFRDNSNVTSPFRYKLIDLKPLFGIIFQPEIKEYHIWGHVDNDVFLGRVRLTLTAEALASDVINPIKGRRNKKGNLAWGPMTLYRNDDRVNYLFLRAPLLCEMLRAQKPWGFDEWFGANGTNMHDIIVAAQNDPQVNLCVAPEASGAMIGWDGFDALQESKNLVLTCEIWCPTGNETGLCRTYRNCYRKDISCTRSEVGLCHFQYKKHVINNQISGLNESQKQELLSAEAVFVSGESGFWIPDREEIECKLNVYKNGDSRLTEKCRPYVGGLDFMSKAEVGAKSSAVSNRTVNLGVSKNTSSVLSGGRGAATSSQFGQATLRSSDEAQKQGRMSAADFEKFKVSLLGKIKQIAMQQMQGHQRLR